MIPKNVHNLPKPDVFWKPPKRAQEGDDGPSEIHRAVGNALDVWEGIEERLCEIYLTAVSRGVSQAAFRAFGAVVGGRKEMVIAAFEAYAYENKAVRPFKNEFDLLLRHFGYAQGRRNELAHGRTILVRIGQANGWFLCPAYYSTRKHTLVDLNAPDVVDASLLRQSYLYNSTQLREIVSRFSELSLAAHSLSFRLIQNAADMSSRRGAIDKNDAAGSEH